MFRKLRWQLTFFNAGIIALLFVLLIMGTYLLSQNQMERMTRQMAQSLARDIVTGKITDLPPAWEEDKHPGQEPEIMVPPFTHEGNPPGEGRDNFPGSAVDLPPRPGLYPLAFFVEISAQGEIIKTSSFFPLKQTDLKTLVQDMLKMPDQEGRLSINQTGYYYLKTNLPERKGMLFVFQDLSPERNARMSVMTALSLAGITCLLLSLAGSLFMANRAIIPIQKSWEQQKGFLADASHELRNPLTVMQTNLEAVLSDPKEMVGNQEKWLHNIGEEISYMAKMVDSLLFLARVDSQQQFLSKDYFSLHDMVNMVVESFQTIAAAQEKSLDYEGRDKVSCYGDEFRMKQVISILVDNAIKYSPAGGRIRVGLEQIGHVAVISVADNGYGMEPEHLDKIFQRFYQIDKSRSKGGAGLGLAIAKLIVEKHRGIIRVSSVPVQGTIFRIHLPLSNPVTVVN
ncbi:sensor histidine kinase [Candidatus Formimonas warabiya]|uniref:histidine kinase n=1 Tax=Formimonas warabiya TaxID=1761012 RepID=A0A3G1KX03_FORW1|nr:HAMP domain-containing sensor histidine kinase [Candidatus Formimonas warabiya]ATW27063.1 hypothetical protein DCMF_21915 [Candidatus Formimonas warabiya]